MISRCLETGECVSFVGDRLPGDRVLGLGLHPGRPTRLFAWTHAGGLFRSDDGADSWRAVDSDEALRRSTAQLGLTTLVVDPAKPAHVYFGNGSVVLFVNP